MVNLKLALFLAIMALLIGQASATTYNVAKTGNDTTGNGSSGNPWLTINHSAQVAVAGDTVFVKAGEYNEYVTVLNNGSAGNYITFQNYSTDIVTINASGLSYINELGGAWSGNFRLYNRQFINISGFRLINGRAGVHIDGASNNITISNSYIEKPYHSCIKSGSFTSGVWSNNLLIENNTCNRNNTGTVEHQEGFSMSHVQNSEYRYNSIVKNSHGEGYDFKDGSNNNILHNNYCTNLSSSCIYIDGYSEGAHNNSVYNNRIENMNFSSTDAVGICFGSERGGLNKDNIVYNNLISDVWIGIAVSSYTEAGYYTNFSNDTIINNVIYYSRENAVALLATVNVYNIIVRNNIIVPYAKWYTIDNDCPTNCSSDHNLFWNIDGSDRGSGTGWGNPQFINTTNGYYNFSLKNNSPAIDNGSNILAPPLDYLGNIRPYNSRTSDIGAYESEYASPNNVPVISFTSPTPANNSVNTTGSIQVNTSISNDNGNNMTALLNWNTSLLGWWRMNEAWGSSTIQDFSGKGNNGTFVGNTTSTVISGKFGNALDFDGVDDYVNITNQSLNVSSYTIMAWFKTTETSPDSSQGRRIVSIDRASGNLSKITLMMRNNRSQFAWANSGNTFTQITTGITSNDGIWHHFVGTTDGINFKVYQDGLLQNSTTSTLTPLFYQAYLGKLGTTAFYEGQIDDVIIHNRVLSNNEINASYNASAYRLFNNFTNLADGNYNATAFVQDSTGAIANTETRYWTVDTTATEAQFTKVDILWWE